MKLPLFSDEGNDTLPDQSAIKGATFAWHTRCREDSELRFIIMPYMFPLLIEFTVMASALALAIWDNCGHGMKPKRQEEQPDISDEESARRRTLYNRRMMRNFSVASISIDMMALDDISRRDHTCTDGTESAFDSVSNSASARSITTYPYNGKSGFVMGWITICAAVGLVIVCLYIMYSEDGVVMNIEHAIYGSNLALSTVCLIVIPITLKSMSALTFKDDEIKKLLEDVVKQDTTAYFKQNIHHKLDNYLVIITLLALFAFKIFSAIGAIEQEAYLLLADAIISMIMALVQSFFLMYSKNKRSKTEEHLKERPGRQGLEFLRSLNFALWLINTFLLKHPEAKRVQNLTYEYLPWSILSNVFQPLTILFYFHTMVCIADVLQQAYTDKYVGLVRKSKRRMGVYEPPDF